MIRTLLRIGFISLSRDRVAQSMTFILPIAFFSIFALVFGNQGRDRMPRVKVAVVDEDRSPQSARVVAALEGDSALRVVTRARAAGSRDTTRRTIDRARAEALVRDGEVPAAIVLPAGIGLRLGTFGAESAEVQVLTDPSDPIAGQIVAGLLPRSIFGGMPSPLKVKTASVMGHKRDNSLVAFYAAGIAVMFLLFSVSAGGGTLLEEMESGTLERVLGTRVGMTGLLLGKWLFLTLMGMLQITVMFLWGMTVFKLDLLSHLPGFIVMTTITAAAAAGFGLVFATACRTRAQLSSIATLVILCSSAVGGSMFPRFLMSETMQKLGLVTFNAWALDGYIKVFWRDARIVELAPQVGMLLAFGTVFLATARLLARRWEAA